MHLYCECEGISVQKVGRNTNVWCSRKVEFKKCFPFCKGKSTIDSSGEDPVGETVPNSPKSACFPFCDQNGRRKPNSPGQPCFPFCDENGQRKPNSPGSACFPFCNSGKK